MTDIAQFLSRFPDDDACLSHLFRQRFTTHPPCRDCGAPANWFRIRSTRGYSTNCCRGQRLSPQAGTLFDRTTVPLRMWFYAMLLFANSRTGVGSAFLASHLGISYRAAWRMATCIRLHMTALEANRPLGGTGRIVRIATTALRGVRTREVRGKGRIHLIGLADDACARAMPYAVRARPRLWRTLQPIITSGSVLVVEEPSLHAWLEMRLQHQRPEARLTLRFEPAATATDPLDGFFLGLKRSMRHSHQHIGRDGVERFLGEFAFRYNRRHPGADAFADMIAAFPPIARPGRTAKGSPNP